MKEKAMRKVLLLALIALFAVTATTISAQVLDLTGQFRCVQGCSAGLPGQSAFVTQNGWELRLVNDAGEPTRAWIDRPGHIWAQYWDEGAFYSPDGMTIQFDRGTVWQRDLGPPEPAAAAPPASAPPNRTRVPAAASVESPPAALNAFDGAWSVVIVTQSGNCDNAYRYGLRISNGYIANDGGEPVSLQGRVWPNGVVRVSVSSGGQQARGEGRLSRTSGSGVWSGQGSAGYCAGMWQAARR
jgi:hypothetical protein